MYRRQRKNVERFSLIQTQRVGRHLDNFVRYNSDTIRNVSQALAPLLAPEAPAAAAAIATIGQGAASYSSLRGQLDRAAA